MAFKVIDKKTGKEADTYKIALKEDWAKCLVYCDIEGFALTEDGVLVLMDECGNVAYCPDDRFEIAFEKEKPQGDLISRELLKKDIDAQISYFDELNKKGEPYKGFKDIRAILFGLFIGKNLIDNIPTVDLSAMWAEAHSTGYDVGYNKAKEDVAKRIKEQYNKHHELIPYWLSVGDVKGGTE